MGISELDRCVGTMSFGIDLHDCSSHFELAADQAVHSRLIPHIGDVRCSQVGLRQGLAQRGDKGLGVKQDA
jgi:hypothetical protein